MKYSEKSNFSPVLLIQQVPHQMLLKDWCGSQTPFSSQENKMYCLLFSPPSKANEAMSLPGITDAPGHSYLEKASKLGPHSHSPSQQDEPVSQKIQSEPDRVILFGGNAQDFKPWKLYLSSSDKTAPRRQEGKSAYIQVCNKGSRQTEHQRSGIKLRKLALCFWEDASLWTHWIHSFHIQLSHLGPTLVPCSPYGAADGC